MNCVTCEKCKLWGTLQILGIGTAIKILLMNEEEINHRLHESNENLLSRQEVIALVNTLHQLSKSVKFVSKATELEFEEKVAFISSSINAIVFMAFTVVVMMKIRTVAGNRRNADRR